MKISHSKLATAVMPSYVHSGKVDRDNGFKGKRANNTKAKVCRRVKKKQRRLLDSLEKEE